MAKKNLAQQAVESQAEMKEEMFLAVSKETEVISLDFDGIKEQELHQMAKDYANLVVTEEKASFDAGKKARAALRGERYNIQNIVKDKKAILNEVKKKIEDKGNGYISIILPTEEHIDSQIKEIEAEQNRIKEEKRLAEEERKRKLQEESVAYVEGWRQKVRECTTAAALKKLSKEMESAVIPEFEDYYNGVVIHINNIIEAEIPFKSNNLLREKELGEEKKKREELEAKIKEMESQQKASVPDVVEVSFADAGKEAGNEYSPEELHDIEYALRKMIDSISMEEPDIDYCQEGDKIDIFLKVVQNKLKEVQEFAFAEIDKLFPKD